VEAGGCDDVDRREGTRQGSHINLSKMSYGAIEGRATLCTQVGPNLSTGEVTIMLDLHRDEVTTLPVTNGL
jgi:hypothetical protein